MRIEPSLTLTGHRGRRSSGERSQAQSLGARIPAGPLSSGVPPSPGEPVSQETIETEIRDRILTITLNRPDRLNAFNSTMLEELLQALDDADADDEVRAILFTGAGRAYCAGADLGRGGATLARGAG